MEIKISDEIIKSATECDNSLQCLKNPENIKCKVERCIEKEVHFIKCLYKSTCSYKMSFGHSYLCNCPVRKEIFNKYKI